jgi:hypothetical protein
MRFVPEYQWKTPVGSRAINESAAVLRRSRLASFSAMSRNLFSAARAVFRLIAGGESRAIDVSGGEKLEPGELIYKPNYGISLKLQAVFTPEVNVKEVLKP